MKKPIKQIFCILLLLLCLLPLAVFVIAGPSASGANERLAAKPRLTAGGRLNFDVLSDMADYFDGHFGLRQELITANAAADAAIFRESATPEVLLGTDGWLYYADTLADYTGADPMTERQLWCAARNLALLQEYAQSQGADSCSSAHRIKIRSIPRICRRAMSVRGNRQTLTGWRRFWMRRALRSATCARRFWAQARQPITVPTAIGMATARRWPAT